MRAVMRLTWRFLRREWRFGEWQIFLAVIFLLVTITVALQGTVTQLTQYFAQRGAQFIGGDLAVRSNTPLPAAWQLQAPYAHLRAAEMWTFPSVAVAGQNLYTINVIAVSAHYPLWRKPSLPVAGHVWVEGRLYNLLQRDAVTHLAIGAKTFSIQQASSDRLAGSDWGWAFAPRVMIRLSDVPATRTVVPGSRVTYYLLLAGAPAAIQHFRAWLTPRLQPGQQMRDIHSQSFLLQQTLQRWQLYWQFILLAELALTGLAVFLLNQRYLQRARHELAILRCLGIRRSALLTLVLQQRLLMSFMATTAGIIAGYGLQWLFQQLFSAWFPVSSLGWSGRLIAEGYLIGIGVTGLFTFPLLWEVFRLTPFALFKAADFSWTAPQQRLWLIISGIIVLVALGVTRFSLFGLWIVAMLVELVAISYFLSQGLLLLTGRLACFSRGAMRQALLALTRPVSGASLQLTAFTWLLSLGLLLTLLQRDLWQEWQHSLPPHTPNYFALNIAPADVVALTRQLQRAHIPVSGMYPMVRGRLVALNGRPILAAIPPAGRSNNALHRELNLSWMMQLPQDNKILQGSAWTAADTGKPWISIEKNLAQDLAIHLGDRLTFQIGTQQITGEVRNIRQLQWSSFHPNFYIIFPPGVLQTFPTTYLTSFYATAAQAGLLSTLITQFPNMTIIDVASLLQQMQQLLRQLTQAVQWLLAACLSLGIAGLWAGLLVNQPARYQTWRLWYWLGSSRRFIRRALLGEFVIVAVVSGSGAWVLGNSLAWLCARTFFQLPFVWQWQSLGWSIVIALAGILLPALIVYYLPLTKKKGLFLA